MAEDLKPLILKISADIKGLTQGLDKAEKKTKGFGDTVKKFAGVAAAGALAAVGKAAVGMAVEFNKAMGAIETLIPGNTERINQLAKSVEGLSLTTGKAATDIAGGLFEVVSAFGDSAESADILKIAVRSATAGLATTESSVKLLSGVMKGYNDVSAASAQKTSDLAFLTNKLGQTTFPELAASMGNVVPIASTLGVKQEELFGIMATLTGVTGNTAEVSTQLKAAMSNLLKPNKDLLLIYEDLNVEGAVQLIQQEGLVGAMRILQKETGGSTAKFGKLFKSTEALNAVFALTGSQADVFDEKFTKMGVAAGSAEEAFEAYTTGINKTGFEMEVAQRKIDALMRSLGEQLLPVIGDLLPLLDSGLKLFGSLTPVIRSLAPIITGAAQAFAILAEAFAIALEFAEPLLAIFGELEKAGKMLGDAIGNDLANAFAGTELRLKVADVAYKAFIEKNKDALAAVEAYSDGLRRETAEFEELEKKTAETKAKLDALEKVRLEKVAAEAKKLKEEMEAAQKAIDAVTSSLDDLTDQGDTFRIRFNKDVKALGGFEAAALANADAAIALIKEHERLGTSLSPALEMIKSFLIEMGKFPEVAEEVSDSIDDIDTSAGNLIANLEDFDNEIMQGILPDPSELEQFKSEFEKIGEASSAAFVEAFESTIRNTGDLLTAIGVGMGAAISAGLEEGLDDHLASLTKVLERNLGDALGGAIGGAIGAAIPVLGQFLSNQIGSFISNAFSGPTNQELFAKAGTKAGQAFGANWSAAAQSAMERVGNSIQKAASGKVDIVAAMWHPETLIEVLKNIETAGLDVQKTWAQNLEDNVKPVLMTTLGMSEAEAAAAMAPLFNEILSKITPGSPIDAEFQRMLDWATSMGVTLSSSFDMAADAAKALNDDIKATGASILDILERQTAVQDTMKQLAQDAKKTLGKDILKSLKEEAREILADGIIDPEELERIKAIGGEGQKFLIDFLQLKMEKQGLAEAENAALLNLEAQLAIQLKSLAAVLALKDAYNDIANINIGGGGGGGSDPERGGSAFVGGGGTTINNNTFNSDNPESFRNWMRNGNGANEIADFANKANRTQIGNRNRGQ